MYFQGDSLEKSLFDCTGEVTFVVYKAAGRPHDVQMLRGYFSNLENEAVAEKKKCLSGEYLFYNE